MSRIKPLTIPLSKELQSSMDKVFPSVLPSPNLYRMVARNKALWNDLVESRIIGRSGLFDKKRLSPKLREQIILRTCVAAKNGYEFALHVETISEKMGLSREQIADIRNSELDTSLWIPADIILFSLIDLVF